MITLEESALYNEVLAIRADGSKPVTFYWVAELHTKDKNFSAEINLLKVMNVDTVRDYEKAIADEVQVQLMIPLGLWAKQIYPKRTELEMTLYRRPIGETAGTKDNSNLEAQRYKVSPVLEGLPVPQGKDVDMISEETLNLRDILQINFQLLSHTVDKLRLITVGGIFRNATNEDVMKATFAAESNKVKVDTGNTIESIDIVPATNTAKRDHVVIPHGVKLTDLPLYLHEHCGGVYSAGINAYIQGRTWYVYPLYDNTRLQKAPAIVTIIKVPSTISQGSERTYRQNGNETIILATSDSTFSDDAGTQYLNDGNGVRFVDANKFLNGGLTKTKNNKAVALRGQLVNEVVTSAQEGRQHVKMSERKITANPFREYSKMAARNGAVYIFQWDNSNASLLTPGMMVKILYLDGDNIAELTGVLLKTHTVVQLQGGNIQSERHTSTTACAVFVSKEKST